jgi:DNA-directed RNA polymerase subunit M/transcription elongation factor TFIIS
MLEFCPVCKKLLEIGEWKGKQVGKCSCGFIRTSGINILGEDKSSSEKVGLGISNSESSSGFNFLCSKCGHDKAEVKILGEILGNEKSVTLFTCLKCGKAERK